ncbi:gliding motility-associated C-terminal domain-containing protein [Saprospiraceae bacterium]|nr:gliding motility-associated C-terminal domain-containing protein [Saprospiraceae bacterium]
MSKRFTFITLILFIISLQNLYSQCTDGTQPECQCSTANVLCTVDDLDNYMFSMSSFQHPQDAPEPLCPGANGTVPNNPTWFAFTAWCTDLTLEASFSNCTQMNGSIGVQIAIYEDCTFQNAVACNVSGFSCNTNSKTLTMTGLTIGGVYYFLVDGCLGSYCDVTIDIIGVCGEEEIDPWTQGVTGETNACGGNTETYSVETLAGAATYHWFVDGVLLGTSATPTFDVAWASAGSYQLCIDVSNDPCVPITDLPAELCTTINVYESEAGTITAPTPLCPNEVANISVAGYNMGIDNAQAILVTDPSGVILEVISGASGTYTSSTCGTFTLYSYNYIPSIGTVPVVGNNINAIDCSIECCDLESLTLSFEDTVPPVLLNPPADETLTCSDLVQTMADLNWSDNCDGTGTVAGTETGSADACNGGTITRNWEYTDACGNMTTHTQTITVTGTPPPTFTNPPADQTVTCDNIPTSAADLNYTNGGSGACEISGMISPTQSGSVDICGGTISYNWDFTDVCGNTISHTQNITVTPTAPPAFINPPADINVTCDNIPTSAPDLDYTNNENGSCLVIGTVSPTQSGSADICGGTVSYNWDFTDICGNNISHTQNITVTPAAPPAFINPPADINVTCDNIPTGAPDLDYSNNENGSCLVTGTVSPTQSGSVDICGGTVSYNWEFTDICGNNISHTQNITVIPAAAPTFINPPADINVTCDNIPTGAPDLDYSNNENGSCLVMGTVSPTQSGSADECGGTISFTWTFTDICNNTITHIQNYIVDPAPLASFIGNLPQDLTVDCDNVPGIPSPLQYTNNESGICLIAGFAQASQSGSYNECGGLIVFLWEFTDDCGRTISHTQNINVNPAPPAAFLNPPSATTIDCSSVPGVLPTLNYTNNQNGACSINGFVTAIQSGFYDACGGNIIYTWTYTDDCNRSISHSQNVAITPANDPIFTSLPADLTINCGEPFPTPINLSYTNNESGPCAITGNVPATVTNNGNGGLEYTWSFINPCNNVIITHTQIIDQIPSPNIFINPTQIVLCEGETFDLSTILVTDLNNTGPNITFHSGTPATIGNQLPSSIVNPLLSSTYYLLASNSFGCSDEANFEVVVEDPPFAGLDGMGEICFDSPNNINLFSYLSGAYNPAGTWVDTYGYGVNLSNPNNVSLIGLPPGTYTFDYVVASGGVCPDDVASVTLEFLPEVFIFAFDISCTSNPDFYEVSINNFGFDIIVLAGTYVDLGNNLGIVTDIPISQSLVIIATNPSNLLCTFTLNISPPDCDCPNVDPPVNNGDAIICEGSPAPQLSVSVGADETANWYNAPSGGTLLQNESTTFTPTETTVGVYTYYVESESLINGCVSSILTPIQFEISANPVGNNAQLEQCDIDGDGFTAFDLTEANTLISSNLTYSYTYYETIANAQNEINSLSNLYTNIDTPTQNLFVVLLNSANCSSIVELELLVNPLPTFTLQVEDETCLDDGDGSVTIDSPTGMNYSLDNSNWTTNNVFDNLNSGNYTAYIEDDNGCIASQSFDINPGLEITLSNFEINCDDNGTPSDAMDDFYNITFTLTNNNGNAGTFSVFDGNLNTTNLNYNQSNTITLPAQGQSSTMIFTDELISCLITQSIGPLNSCSSDCSISINQLDIICSDNGTSNDETDDFYTVTINAFAINGAANNSYNVLIDGLVNFNYTYNTVSTFTIPADGSSPIISVVDNQDPQCQATQTIGPLTSCSDPCVINFDLVEVLCSDNGTITDPTDDFYDINIQASAVNSGTANSFEIFVNNISQGIFDYSVGAMFTLPADGSAVIILIQDADETLCSAEQNIGTLEPCNEECSINATVSNIICDDNGTGNDDTDDTFTFDLLVNGQNISASWQSTDGTLSGNYGATQNFGPFNIANGDLNFDLQDLTTLTCTTSISVNAPSTCSDPCVINFDLVEVLCNDNGTITDPTDDFYDINIQASAVNSGTANSFEFFVNNISQGIFDYSIGAMFNLPADGSAVTVLIQDANEPLCSAEQNIGTLEPCNEDCSINATVSNIICDDNGTGNDDTDDTFTFDLLVNGQNIGANWQSTDGALSGNYGATQNFGPFNIANGDLNFELQDLTTLTCTTPILVTTPTTCSFCPQTIDAGTGSTLNCNNTTANLIGSSSDVGIFLWSGPNSFSASNLATTTTTPGWYFLTGAYPNNCTSIDSVFIGIENEIPSANAGSDQFINCNILEVTLNGSGSSGTNLEFEWTTSGGTFISNQEQITTSTEGIYILQLTDLVSGCTSTDQVEVFVNTNLPSAVIYADPDNILDCVISSITLTSDNEPNIIYSWNSVIAPEYVVTEGSIVNLIAIDTITGCQNFNEITISDIQDYPFVVLDPPSPISCYEPNSLIDGSNSQQGVNIIYNWYDANNNLIVGQNENSLLVDNGGLYYLQLIDTLNGCENTDSVFVESLLNIPSSQALEDITLFCGETETNLNVTILSNTDNLEITWTTSNGNIISGTTTQNPLVDQPGTYTVSIQNLISGCIVTDDLNVVINTNIPQLINANIYDETCFEANDGLISIVNISGGEPPFTYNLNGNPTDNSGQFQNLSPGFYNILLTDSNGCTLEDNFIINPGINLELNLPEIIEILEGNTGIIQAIVNVPIDSLEYIQWAPPELLSCDTCLTTTIEAVDDQTFQLTIIDNNGCLAIAVINIIVLPKVKIYIPNAFSPNFDGYNDYFTLFANDQVEEILEMSIFDRWGEHVFKKENFQPNEPIIGWNGRFKGEDMNSAVFVYIFKVKLKDGSTRVFSGDVTLMK